MFNGWFCCYYMVNLRVRNLKYGWKLSSELSSFEILFCQKFLQTWLLLDLAVQVTSTSVIDTADPSVVEQGTVTQSRSGWGVRVPGVAGRYTNLYTNSNYSELYVWNSNECNLIMKLFINSFVFFCFLEVKIFQAELPLTNSLKCNKSFCNPQE